MKTEPIKGIKKILDELACEVSESVSKKYIIPGQSGLSNIGVLVAVSGGSDSMALLCLLHRLMRQYQYQLFCVTVDHGIRTRAESGGDADFVFDFCAKLNPPVPCYIERLSEGEVFNLSIERGRGVEEAARFLRYQRFESVADRTKACFILTGHTHDDQMETILMRFFQGAAGTALGGITKRRDRYVRPLLSYTRADLRDWLTTEGYTWREDSTNTNDQYLRNRIRRHVIPLLNTVLPGWDSGVSVSAEKSRLDDQFCRSLISASWKRSGSILECSQENFFNMHPTLRIRFLTDGLNLLNVQHRVPYGLLKRIADIRISEQNDSVKRIRICGSGLRFWQEAQSVFWGPDIVYNTKSGYLVYIAVSGCYTLPTGLTVDISEKNGNACIDTVLGPFQFPFVIRSKAGGDTVRTAEGKRKSLKKILNEWSVPENERGCLPVVEQKGQIRAVYGSCLGYPDWYIHI